MILRRSVCVLIFIFIVLSSIATADERSHPRLMADEREIALAQQWMVQFPWYRHIIDEHKKEIDAFLAHGPIHVSPLKQTYQYQMYTCPKHLVELLYDEQKPFEHRCPRDTMEVFKGGKYDMAWAGWYNRRLASYLVWMGILYNLRGDTTYAEAGRSILTQFADLYLKYPTENTILGPAHVFFGTLSESFWGVDMVYGYDLLYAYKGFSEADRRTLKEELFYPLAHITQLFPESASNRQLWYNDVSAAVGFLYGDQELIDFAVKGKYGFEWQLGSALPESGFWPEWSGYHYVALRGMIHLAEMGRHNGYDFYHQEIAGRSMKKMFDSPFLLIKPNYEFPRIKDSGGGSILEYAPYYEVGYAVFRDPRYLALLNLTHLQRGTQLVGETSALGQAPEPITMFNLVPDLPGGTQEVRPFESFNLVGNGFAVLRNGEGRNYLYLDYGIMGGEHGHPDRLQIGYYANGRNWIVDPLNELYTNPNLQLWYRQSIAHNTLVVDQTTQTWTNGFGRYFGSLPSLQVASGGTTTAYPGITLTRTVLQIDNYFIDLFDATAPEKHVYDLPLHGFGTLTISGATLEQQPVDLFGNKPGIPGYDQLTQIAAGPAHDGWHGVFTDKGKRLAVRILGEPGTQVMAAMTPPIGGFYKQMVDEQVRVPMAITRRITSATRFASLIESCEPDESITAFSKTGEPDTYCLERRSGNEYIHADVAGSHYSLVRVEGEKLRLAAGFNIAEISLNGKPLISSSFPLEYIQCRWSDSTIEVIAPAKFDRLKINGEQVARISVNGSDFPFTRKGAYVMITQATGIAVEVTTSRDSLLFIGRDNTIRVQLWNPGKEARRGTIAIQLAQDWEQRVQSQVTWWGGIVNLIATNKKPVERHLSPPQFASDVSWIHGLSSQETTIPSGGTATVVLRVHVPPTATPATYPARVIFCADTVRTSFVVCDPVNAHLRMPNGATSDLVLDISNNTPDRVRVDAALTLDSAWTARSSLRHSSTLSPAQSKSVRIPISLTGYTRDDQLYPIHARISLGEFRLELVHDFYVTTARFAVLPPSFDGSWKGWVRDRSVRIHNASQIGRLLFGNQPWRGEKDLSASISVMYDATYLYVGADVTDDSLVTHWDFPRMSYPWDTDAMEVVLDARTDCTQGHDPPTPGMYRHLSLAEYRMTDFGAEAWQGGGAGGPLLPTPNLVPGAETFFHRTAGGYSMFVRYPLASLRGIVATPGGSIGFDVAINDNDGTNYRKNQHIWAGYNQNQSWWDIGTIGRLVFGPRPSPKTPAARSSLVAP
jgi:hypothetical protein